jgi:transcription initiation factor TFIIIB Brf1 subunit/transcription initiation factor TFIIB
MNCPACNSKTEMVLSVLSHGFVCQEAGCGFELELDWQDAEVLLHPEEELTFA